MNCLLFDTSAPFSLSPDNPKLEHIKNVLKFVGNEEIFAGQKNGKLFICSYNPSPDGSAELVPIREINNPPSINASIAVSFARPQIAQRLLFESACFGVDNLIFYPATKGEKDYIKSSLYAKGEYQKWLEKGAEQACATAIPHFECAESIADAVEKIASLTPPDTLKIAPDVYEATSSISSALFNSKDKHIATILGSERGFDNADRQLLRDKNFTLVSLGNRVLRTDTAIIATLSHIAMR
ncbi:MAG: RNA methyltransferase [Opitutales bacterium]|nr:RNA methyltransferase [Opitutales bacterium]MBP3357716.1 RNA methyltransferase [Opitutales bacterium]